MTITLNNSQRHVIKCISDDHNNIISLVNYTILCNVISMFGSVANVINMVVFYRQGLDTTINISFFSLAVSDFCSLVSQLLFNVFVNPLFLDLALPIVYAEFQYMTTGAAREMFARITCLITAFITTERCLCVVFPLHIKQIITPRRTGAVIIVIYIFTLLSPAPFYITSYYDWIYYSDLNRTLLGLAFTEHHYISIAIVYSMHSFFALSGFLSVVIFTLILIYKLKKKNSWRQSANVDMEKAKSMYKRDRATITMVVFIAGILVVCYTPAFVAAFATLIIPDLTFGGKLSNLYNTCWSVVMVCEDINSSINIFLYYKMSSKYRSTFKEVFSRASKKVFFPHDKLNKNV